MDYTTRGVLRRQPHFGSPFQYCFDGEWLDAEGMDFETRIGCLLFADDCALFASSDADVRSLYLIVAEISKAGGMLFSTSNTKASVHRSWITATEWLGPKSHRADGSNVEEANTFQYLGQRKAKREARPELYSRSVDSASAWHPLEAKIFRCKRVDVKLGIRL